MAEIFIFLAIIASSVLIGLHTSHASRKGTPPSQSPKPLRFAPSPDEPSSRSSETWKNRVEGEYAEEVHARLDIPYNRPATPPTDEEELATLSANSARSFLNTLTPRQMIIAQAILERRRPCPGTTKH